MTPTDEITDPTWHDIFDRDKEIKRLSDRLSRLLDAYGASMKDFSRCVEEKEALIRELGREIELLRNQANHSLPPGQEGGS